MKTYKDRLQECPIDMLKARIKWQEAEVAIVNRDLETMRSVLAERTSNEQTQGRLPRKRIMNNEKPNAGQASPEVPCSAFHACHCGTATHTPHDTGRDGCQRIMAAPPKPAPDNKKYGKMWEVDGRVITDHTLRLQRGYHQHECGCWSRWQDDANSLPDDV